MTRAPSPGLAEPPAIDLPTLDQLRALDPGGQARLIPRVLQTYLQSLDQLLPQLRRGADAGDLQAVSQAAHTLRSSSASVGALALAQWCRRCETGARAAQWPEMRQEVAGLLAEAGRVTQVLRGMLAAG